MEKGRGVEKPRPFTSSLLILMPPRVRLINWYYPLLSHAVVLVTLVLEFGFASPGALVPAPFEGLINRISERFAQALAAKRLERSTQTLRDRSLANLRTIGGAGSRDRAANRRPSL